MRARGSVDRATDSGSVGRGFKSLRARYLYRLTRKSRGHFLSWDKPNLPYETEWEWIVWNKKISQKL
jgi:hypothetical protein